MAKKPCGDSGVTVCEGHEYDAIFCGRIGCCQWGSRGGVGGGNGSVGFECLSAVGEDSCMQGVFM